MVSILILLDYQFLFQIVAAAPSVLRMVSILILLDYQFLFESERGDYMDKLIGFNPYFTGLSILIIQR